MSDMKIHDVIELIERDLPGWQWLLRTDDACGYMANILVPRFDDIIADTTLEDRISVADRHSFTTYDSDPVTALCQSYERAMAR